MSAKIPNPNLGLIGQKLPVYSMYDYDRDCGLGVAASVHVETSVAQRDGGDVMHAVEGI